MIRRIAPFALAAALVACASANPGASIDPADSSDWSSPSIASTPTRTPLASPATSVAPQPTPTATTASLAVAVDSLAVAVVDGLNVREGPTAAAPIQTVAPGAPTSGQPMQLAAGDQVWVIGEERVDDDIWYEVALDGSFSTGWISGGPADDPWLRAFDRATCPDSLSAALATGDRVKPFSMENLVCFGDQQVSAVVYWLPAESLEVPCPWPGEAASWLICYEAVNVSGDSTPQMTVYGTDGRDDIKRGAWVTMLGHYDDPRSSECPQALGRDIVYGASVTATIVSCRSAFVVDEVRPAVAP